MGGGVVHGSELPLLPWQITAEGEWRATDGRGGRDAHPGSAGGDGEGWELAAAAQSRFVLHGGRSLGMKLASDSEELELN